MFPTAPTLSTLPAAIPRPFKRAALGLFHGKSIQHGNNVPHSLKKTRRTWLPNVHAKTLQSTLLERRVQVQVTARALRTIHKHGGLDNYLLRTSPTLLGDEGMRLRLLVRERLDAQNEVNEVRRAAEEALAVKAKARQEGEESRRKQKERERKGEAQAGLVRGLFGGSV